ncbi:hypothetical protein ACJX0J_015879, partial [Zea mays]
SWASKLWHAWEIVLEFDQLNQERTNVCVHHLAMFRPAIENYNLVIFCQNFLFQTTFMVWIPENDNHYIKFTHMELWYTTSLIKGDGLGAAQKSQKKILDDE